MQAKIKDNLEISKNIKDLEYKKLLNEYNAWLIAIISLSLGILSFIYTATNNILFSLSVSVASIFVINVKREEKSKELKDKINEIKTLSNDFNTWAPKQNQVGQESKSWRIQFVLFWQDHEFIKGNKIHANKGVQRIFIIVEKNNKDIDIPLHRIREVRKDRLTR